ncbi:MAG: serine/threonine-protein phosphatase [Deltaproteobacteria bacterium]|nr:serine/threonine-protein phosphatase [Deltaproteobacteria bacterium]
MTSQAASPDDAQELDSFGLTDQGKRRQRNEDQFLVATLQRSLAVNQTSLPTPKERITVLGKPDATLLMVADGMGGTEAGDVASTIAVHSIASYLCNVTPFKRRRPQGTMTGLSDGLREALAMGEANIQDEASAQELRMGTTMTIVYVLWPRMYVAHVGDSRCYLLRGDSLEQVTTDHTVAQRLADQGVEVGDASEMHHVLWNALGGEKKHEAEVCRIDLVRGDRVLLCTDGLTKHVSNDHITTILRDGKTAEQCCRVLVDLANKGGGSDNITAVVARVPGQSPDGDPTPTPRGGLFRPRM